MWRVLALAWCWWDGCDPDWDAGEYWGDYDRVPCRRCGAPDTSYADRVGDTRRNRFVGWWSYRVVWRLAPPRCKGCGKRFGGHGDCDRDIPF